NSSSGCPGVDAKAGEGIGNAEPGILRPMLAHEDRIARAASHHQPRADGGDSNALGRELDAESLGKSNSCEFAGAVWQKMGNTDPSANRRNVDYSADAPRSHVRKHGQRGKKHAPEVGSHGFVKLVNRH